MPKIAKEYPSSKVIKAEGHDRLGWEKFLVTL
jgi:hypothetical protein